MKRIFVPLLTSLSLAAMTLAAEGPTQTFNFTNAEVKQVLPVYKELTGLELFVDSHVAMVYSPITLQSSEPLSKAETMKRIEKALLEQARVVVTHLDDRRVSVTYNDALPVVSVKKSPGK
jgi:type II secretory pathway component GspD/PulD (secretin)